MSFNQPFCVGGDVFDGLESLEEDLKGHDPFEPFDRVMSAPDDYVEAKSPGVSLERFDRARVKHVLCVFNEPMGHELCLRIYAVLKDGRRVGVYELMDEAHVAVHIWSADDRDAFHDQVRSDMRGEIGDTCGTLFARAMQGRTVRDVYYVYPKTNPTERKELPCPTTTATQSILKA